MTDIIDIAIADYTAKKASPVATISVSDWKDANGIAVQLAVMRIGANARTDIDAARKTDGEQGLKAMTIIKRCYLASDNSKRAFVDTDYKKLMTKVDPDVLQYIFSRIPDASGGV